ncbi:glycosyltransferase family 39 protein [Actinoallomurus bryophytorum]|uniref:4-amino-4-deoxy-L-arabinose transferase-like glycosyltransferase n=1 Tax=Actinoallomurus bryophytorum TaxID=1490222 RepID=A0A543CJ30_9ACTN|nr:glycosyltransferase family 39 protein [Actinoallomurus bryophytorum]TQL97040.1 4-amino-4-deoxy-L-arabinose transferase-like glycosyltransferase [Actinoallomurus bryophytorum]
MIVTETRPERPVAVRDRLARIFAGPPGDPRWARPGLWAVLALAAVLYCWALSNNGDADYYYAAAVRSGTESWKAFFFGSLDSASFVTVDKPPLFLWVMELSCRLFGYGSWSMLLPGALAGVASVAILYTMVRRVFGPAAGLLAALVLTLTPMTVVVDRVNQAEPVLLLLLMLATWACVEAIRTGRRSLLMWSAVFVGLGFDAKMLQAYLILPALAVTYLVAAREPLRRRFGRLALGGGVLVAVSAVWPVIVELWPKSDRPYVGSSSNNTEANLIFCYNGLQHVLGLRCGGNVGFGGGSVSAPNAGSAPEFGGPPGIGRMFSEHLAGQITWLLPFAVVGLVTGLVAWWRTPRTDPRRAALLLWGCWLVVHFALFSSLRGNFHTYYTTQMAPAIAALTAAGAVALTRLTATGRAWLLAASLVGTSALAFVILRRTPDFVPWLRWAIVVLAVLTAAALLLLRPVRPGGVAVAVSVAVLVTVLAGPAAYAVTPLTETSSGYAPQAGPVEVSQTGVPAFVPLPKGVKPPKPHRPGKRSDGRPDSSSGLGVIPPGMARYLVAHRDRATWLAAANSGLVASTIIVETGGRPVMAMGGFGGLDPILTVDRIAAYVRDGRLHYFFLDTKGPWAGTPIAGWIRTNCPPVDPGEYGPRPTGPVYQQLYRCG